MLQNVPYCNYYAHLACHLRDLWIEMDQVIEQTQQGIQSQEVQKGGEILLRKASDINDTLDYIADLFDVMQESGLTVLADMLTNALLNYAYLPTVIQSLCVL